LPPQSPLQILKDKIQNFQQVAAEIAVYQDSTSRVNKQAALLRATDILDDWDESVQTDTVPPYQTLLRRIIRQWRRLISEEGGIVGRTTVAKPVDNPYIAGNPVTGQLFVGREDILTRLEELWCKPGQCESVVIYGHRRMGKSSILKNLGARFGATTTVVNFDMQLESNVTSTAQLFYDLVIALYDNLPEFQQQEIAEPTEAEFASNPTTTLRRFLTKLDKFRQDWRFIITIDEFETIERKIQEGKLEVALLDFLRGLIYEFQWLILALAGLHTLEEMRRDYWNPLFGSVTAIRVSFLTPKAAARLIAQPSPDFDIDYERDALDRIIDLTHRQPYLMQLIGRELVTRFNRRTFEEGREGDRRFALADVEAVVKSPEFYEEGNAYFQGVWEQAEKSQPEEQLAILQQLARQPLTIAELVETTPLSPEQVTGAIATLERHDVIAQQDGRYDYTVELMRRWVSFRE
jgi:AAA+ ATPase superfamily predicted ATPase